MATTSRCTGERAGVVDRWSFCRALEHVLTRVGTIGSSHDGREFLGLEKHAGEQGGAVRDGRVRKDRDIKSYKIQREEQTGLFGEGFRRWRPWAT